MATHLEKLSWHGQVDLMNVSCGIGIWVPAPPLPCCVPLGYLLFLTEKVKVTLVRVSYMICGAQCKMKT